MSIDRRTANITSKLRRREKSLADRLVQRNPNILPLRSVGFYFGRIIFKHFVAAGLVVLVSCVLVLALVLDTNVSASSMTMLDSTPPMDHAAVNPQDQNIDYSKFLHANPNHSRLPCLLCHRRETDSPRPTLPGNNGHVPCAGCHAQQFANSANAICTICHTDTQSGAVKGFPRLKSFNVKFEHSVHTRGVGASCATCHRPSRGGVALTIPAGFSAHTTCYQCHTPRVMAKGRDISSCGTCHQLGRHRRPQMQAAAFRVGFSHAKHGSRQKLNCNGCHKVRTGVAQSRQVTSPAALNHHASAGAFSCVTCHDGKRAFGGDDFSVCTRCHTKAKWQF